MSQKSLDVACVFSILPPNPPKRGEKRMFVKINSQLTRILSVSSAPMLVCDQRSLAESLLRWTREIKTDLIYSPFGHCAASSRSLPYGNFITDIYHPFFRFIFFLNLYIYSTS